MIKFFKKSVFLVIIIILIIIVSIAIYMTYVNSNASNAKNYLIEKYNLNEKEWYAVKYTEYVYEDRADCNSLWIKKCTSDKDLLYEYTFKNKDKETIIVKETINGDLSDDSTRTPVTKEENTN